MKNDHKGKFSNQSPTFFKVLDPIMYRRSDQEIVENLNQVFPFHSISEETLYLYNNLLSSLTSFGFGLIIDALLDYFLFSSANCEENIFGDFLDNAQDGYYIRRVIEPWVDTLSSQRKISLKEKFLFLEPHESYLYPKSFGCSRLIVLMDK